MGTVPDWWLPIAIVIGYAIGSLVTWGCMARARRDGL